MPARSTTKCDIDMTGDLRMIALDLGVKVGTFYWTIHGKAACVVEANGMKEVGLASTPAKAIEAGAAKLFGGL